MIVNLQTCLVRTCYPHIQILDISYHQNIVNSSSEILREYMAGHPGGVKVLDISLQE